MITGYGLFLKYLAIKSHFLNESYDYFKYKNRSRPVKANVASFNRRNDKYFFEKLARVLKTDKDSENFFVANFVSDNNLWIGDALEEQSAENYVKWQKRIQSLTYIFKQNIDEIIDKASILNKKFTDMLLAEEGQHPQVLKMVKKKEITLETLIILDSFFNLFENWNKQIKESVIWPDLYRKCIKYKPFMYQSIDQNKYKLFKHALKEKLHID